MTIEKSTPFCLCILCAAFSQKLRTYILRVGAICTKNSTFDYFDGTNPIIEKGIQLRSPTPVVVPGCQNLMWFDFSHC